jgi:acyl-CoA hydrolase
MGVLRRLAAVAVACAAWGGLPLLCGCEDGGGGGGGGGNVGSNDRNVAVAVGDSITAGSTPAGVAPYPAIVAAMTGKNVVNAGIPGDVSDGVARRVSGLLARHKPGYLLVLIGANDAIHLYPGSQTERNIRSIVQAAKANQTIAIVAVPSDMYGDHAAYRPWLSGVQAAVARGAKAEGGRVVRASLSQADLISDGLHPNQAGQQKIARAFANAM